MDIKNLPEPFCRISVIRVEGNRFFARDSKGQLIAELTQKSFNQLKGAPWNGWLNPAAVFNKAKVFGYAKVYGKAKVFEYAVVSGKAQVKGHAKVKGHAIVKGDAVVYGHAIVTNDAVVSGKAQIGGSAEIHGGNWDGSEGVITSGSWMAPGIPAT